MTRFLVNMAFTAAVLFVFFAANTASAAEQAVQAVRVRTNFGYGGSAARVPEEVDASDGSERLLLLAPGGPLVIKLDITIDGQPYRTDRERMIDELLKIADPEGTGEVRWEEALTNPRFKFARLWYYARNEKARKQLIDQYDRNHDDVMSRFECRLLLAGQLGGPTFSMMNNSYGTAGGTNLFALLDADNDEVISAKEIDGAEQQLKTRDRDENDILEVRELYTAASGLRTVATAAGRTVRQVMPLLGLIGRSLDKSEAYRALLTRYGNDGRIEVMRLTGVPALARELDKNDNGLLDEAEIAGLNDVEPHLHLAVHLGDTGDKPAGISLLAISEQFGDKGQVEAAGEPLKIRLDGAVLELHSSNVNRRSYNYESTAKSLVSRYDKDNNAYLEKKELGEGRQAAYIKQQFDAWDLDSDGKVYVEEVKTFYEQQARPQMYRVSAAAADMGGSILTALDDSGDGRLGLREMRIAHRRLMKFDKDGDGQITRSEVPSTIRLAVARGAYAYTLARNQYNRALGRAFGQGGGVRPQPAQSAGPDWFARMDKNGDGDITLKEFLGDEEQFKKLDTNDDGFIERKEAEAAGS